MTTQNFNKETADFSKNVLKMSFDTISAFSSQAEVATELFLAAVPSIPEEGKKVAGTYFKESQKALVNLKKHLETGLELDLTDKDAPVKSLEALENFCSDVFSKSAEIRNETKTLVENATKHLPREAKSIVNFWNDSINFGFDAFQNYTNKNFEFAKKIATETLVVKPVVNPKAAK